MQNISSSIIVQKKLFFQLLLIIDQMQNSAVDWQEVYHMCEHSSDSQLYDKSVVLARSPT